MGSKHEKDKKKQKDKYRKYRLERAKIPRDIPDYFHQLLEAITDYPSDFIVPPLNPKGFGIERPELLYKSPLITGQILFDDTFYNVLPPPPLGEADPAYKAWQKMVKYAQRRDEICQPGKEGPRCTQARNDYFDAARDYATALDKTWGLNRFRPGGALVKTGTGGTRPKRTTGGSGATGETGATRHTGATEHTGPVRSSHKKKTRT